MRVYLDTSALLKRYLKEIGSESIDILYDALERDSNLDNLVFSSWNLGEAFGAIDARCQRHDISEEAMAEALSLLSLETKKFVAMRKVTIVPLGTRILSKSRSLVLKYHIYQADALQLESAKQVQANVFVSADRRLVDCARSEQLEVLNPEKDYDSIQNRF